MEKAFYFLISAVLILSLACCSSAPPPKEEEVAVKNQAIQFAESGNNYYNQGMYEPALSFFKLSLAYNGSIYDEPGIVLSYCSIGKVYIAQSRFNEAMAEFDKALTLARSLKSAELIATCLNNIGEMHLAKKELDAALDVFEQAIEAGKGIPAKKLSVIYHNRGAVNKRLGNLDAAIDDINRALGINLSEKNFFEVATNYYMLASVHSEKGDYKTARDIALKALATDKKIENSIGIAKDYGALGIISLKLGNDADAYGYFHNSLLIYESLELIHPTTAFRNEKQTVLDRLIPLAQKIDGEVAADRYRKLRKETDR